MIGYIENGWYEEGSSKILREEVLDGAMDIATSFLQVSLTPEFIEIIAFKVRKAMFFIDPQMQSTVFNKKEQESIIEYLQEFTLEVPVLEGFIMDCLEEVNNIKDLFALYLHMIHIARMMQLLKVAITSKENLNEI